MIRWVVVIGLTLIGVVSCSQGVSPRAGTPTDKTADPAGSHQAAIAAQVQPFLDAEVVSGLVVGIYDAGKLEIYGFGAGPGGARPNGRTLFELGSVTKVYTSLVLADAVQRKEVELDGPVADLLPPGVTVPTKDGTAITLRHLAVHVSGLPRLPPSLLAKAGSRDPYAGYSEDALYQDLIATELIVAPGTAFEYSNFGAGLLGFALGRKIGPDFPRALRTRVLDPLGLRDTYVVVPASEAGRRAQGTTNDLKATPPWTFDAMAGAGALVSTARDQLTVIAAELDAITGSKEPLRAAMRLTQEKQMDQQAQNAGLGWIIDRNGRYWHNGGTGGFHAFIGFDPSTKRGVVLLASTSTSLVDRLADVLYQVLDGKPPSPVVFPTPDKLASYAGTYDFSGSKLTIRADGKRLYIEGPGEPLRRLAPISDHEFLLEELQALAIFQREGDKIARIVFVLDGKQLA
ncbi:MAG: serine hydrolase domain-containing protein, partial [Kofleriaceae bacterium]